MVGSRGQSCPKQQCEEPFVHTSGGVPVNQFAISFVNHAQLRRGIPSPDAISAAHHSLAADHAEDHMQDHAEADAEEHMEDHAEEHSRRPCRRRWGHCSHCIDSA